MPDNSLGEHHTAKFPTRPGQSYNPGGSGAEVMRAIDGRLSPGGEGDQLDDLANPHELGQSAVNILLIVFLVLVILVVLFRLV